MVICSLEVKFPNAKHVHHLVGDLLYFLELVAKEVCKYIEFMINIMRLAIEKFATILNCSLYEHVRKNIVCNSNTI